ncbi:beta-carotene 3-hydroxylase [Dyadobacter jejuensis]|uniref:Beta-carotene 3-hydroxylase n=1 Tax=Dyadobacter jejuensis TaxID=1082580 RepID=A0A316AMW6_9BACT|nr:sterol desaturase family protein [Dyadobacter jejuensis]PWJ59073.1 beta-carotene 3-hydroxylase [Dyadobacter jejuensis]
MLITFLCMESVAWLAHKYLMHGFLWFLHEDHHQRDDQNFFEKNDFFFLIFAIPAIILMYLGIYQGFPYVLWIGAGITIYGAAYFLIHDVFIHRRFKWLRNADSPYFRAIRRAHKMHHKHLGKHHGECFGMLWVPMKYYKESLNPKRTK